MPKHRKSKNPIARLLGLAFAAASEADEDRAREYLRQAISHGYDPNPKTERDLSFALHHARRDRGIEPRDSHKR